MHEANIEFLQQGGGIKELYSKKNWEQQFARLPDDIAEKQLYLQYARTELYGLQETNMQWILRSPTHYLPCQQFIQATTHN